MRDEDIRSVLRARLALEYGTDPSALVLDEFGLACSSARVDLAVVNGCLHGYEIKSDVDSLARLRSPLMTSAQ